MPAAFYYMMKRKEYQAYIMRLIGFNKFIPQMIRRRVIPVIVLIGIIAVVEDRKIRTVRFIFV